MFCVVDTELCVRLAGNPTPETDVKAAPASAGDARGWLTAAIVTLIAIALCLGAASWS
jgi:hypothetical protein